VKENLYKKELKFAFYGKKMAKTAQKQRKRPEFGVSERFILF
jgi:hypothetical protein